jgi:hypothetical protein
MKNTTAFHDHKLLEAAMEASWQEVKNGDYPPLIRTFYEPLKQLGTRPIDSTGMAVALLAGLAW